MSIFETIVVGLLLIMVIVMLIIGKWVMVIMINSRLINKKIEHHNLIDLELRFFRFLHFKSKKKKESSKYYLSRILKNFKESNTVDDNVNDRYKGIYDTFLKNQKT